MHTRLGPKILTVLREGYSVKQFYSDSAAGTTVGLVALPLAIATGVKPEQRFFTSIVAGFLISFLVAPERRLVGQQTPKEFAACDALTAQ
jgi:SulP family sulfate permease